MTESVLYSALNFRAPFRKNHQEQRHMSVMDNERRHMGNAVM